MGGQSSRGMLIEALHLGVRIAVRQQAEQVRDLDRRRAPSRASSSGMPPSTSGAPRSVW